MFVVKKAEHGKPAGKKGAARDKDMVQWYHQTSAVLKCFVEFNFTKLLLIQ